MTTENQTQDQGTQDTKTALEDLHILIRGRLDRAKSQIEAIQSSLQLFGPGDKVRDSLSKAFHELECVEGLNEALAEREPNTLSLLTE